MDDPRSVGTLEELLALRGGLLLRTAVLLAGSQEDGEDLLQAALERVYRRWRTVSDPEAYLRRTLYHLAVDGWRRNRAWRSCLALLRPGDAASDSTALVDQRAALIQLLHALPPRQRTAIVLRYWEDLSEAETAAAMGCSLGTVKSATSRGIRRLRELGGLGKDTGEDTGERAEENQAGEDRVRAEATRPSGARQPEGKTA
jgi:RNA polymerase sigma-70 factor (sigma-E family)